ncbi:MAG: hypothetical protein JGK08_10050 [Microcoleus sp. PH2017_04_SCI_O_A]|nr:hypothetical protein [Microcoleus sp. PH2017_04_SCI_O_A]
MVVALLLSVGGILIFIGIIQPFSMLSNIFLVAIGVLVVVVICPCFKQEVARRQTAEGVLRQQTDRERLVNQIAQHIRQSLDLDHVLETTVADVQRFLEADRGFRPRARNHGSRCATLSGSRSRSHLPPVARRNGQRH